MIIKQEKEQLTDGSHAINVVIYDGENNIRFHCVDETAAQNMIRTMLKLIREKTVDSISYEPSYK